MPTIIPTPTTTPVPAPTELKVVYRDGGGGSRTYTVRCGPGTAASVTPAVAGLDAGRACAVTTSERTLLVDGPVPQICAQVYLGPQSATVTGHIDDDPVDLRFGRNTPCRDNDWRRVGALVLRPSGSGRAG